MYYGSARLTLKLVALEGVDFAGKTTLANALDGSTIGGWILRSTGEMRSALGSILRASVATLTPREKIYWFAADRASVLEEVVREWSSQQAVVVWDRYVDSARAYRWADVQLGEDNDLVDLVESVNRVFPEPDLVICLDVDAVCVESRMAGGSSLRSDEERQLLVRRYYRQRAAELPHIYRIIDGDQPQSEIVAAAFALISTLLMT